MASPPSSMPPMHGKYMVNGKIKDIIDYPCECEKSVNIDASVAPQAQVDAFKKAQANQLPGTAGLWWTPIVVSSDPHFKPTDSAYPKYCDVPPSAKKLSKLTPYKKAFLSLMRKLLHVKEPEKVDS